MTYSINSREARSKARQDIIIFREINTIMEQILIDAGDGKYQTIITDETTMTESTPDVVVTGSVSLPTITLGDTLIVNGTTITLGASGTALNNIISDINDANITGLVADKTNNALRLTYTTTQATQWTLEIGNGTANAALGLSAATAYATNPDSVSYYSVWQGVATDRGKSDQMSQIIKFFENLGYQIDRQTNTATGKTFKWVISY
mgnify:CR=1 FL=1